MAETKGRSILLFIGSAAVAGVRTKGFQISAEPIDVTTDDDDGWRKVLTEAGEKSISVSLSGVALDDELLKKAMADADSDHILPVELEYPSGTVVRGSFFLGSYNETGEYQGARTFECELSSSGRVTLVAA